MGADLKVESLSVLHISVITPPPSGVQSRFQTLGAQHTGSPPLGSVLPGEHSLLSSPLGTQSSEKDSLPPRRPHTHHGSWVCSNRKTCLPSRMPLRTCN